MNRCRRVVAIAAVLAGIAAWGVALPALGAQSDAVTIELSFVTAAGEAPEDAVAALDVNTGIEYRNARVSLGEPIEVDAVAGTTSRLQIRRTELWPGDVSCEGTLEAATVNGSRVLITPGTDGAICTVTLSDEAPATSGDELPLTGVSLELAVLGAIVLGKGALLAGASRSARDCD